MSMTPYSLVNIRAHTMITQRTAQYVFTVIKSVNILRIRFIRIKIIKETPARSSVTKQTSISFQNYTIIIIIYCNWVVTRWQWLFYMYTKYEIGY